MDEFTKRLQEIDAVKLKHYLCSLQAPCYESSLLRVAFPAMDIARAEPLTLYQNHFLLFHLLYRLQDAFYREDKYLFVHFMRTRVAAYPEPGRCRFFDEHGGQFCAVACRPAQNYCDFHAGMLGDSALAELSLKSFYLDCRNFAKLDAETATAFINGTWEILAHYEEYRKSFAILGLPETADLKLIKKKFKHLAKQYHPDCGAQSDAKFHEINNAYQLLVQIHTRMSAYQPSKTCNE